MKTILVVVLFLMTCVFSNVARGQDYTNWFPGILHPPKVSLKLPSDFGVFSATPEYAQRDESYDMTYGVLWANQETGKTYAHAKTPSFKGITAPLFWVRLNRRKTSTDQPVSP